jgi:hypothetical protein
MTGIVDPVAGGVWFISESTPPGGVITPPERLSSLLRVPPAGGAVGVVFWLAPGRLLGSSAALAPTLNPIRIAVDTRKIRRIVFSA